MTTPTPEIRQALYRHLLCTLPIGAVTVSDVAWPNVPFIPDIHRMYLAPFCLFAETATASLSQTGFERLSGVFQVSVYGILNTGEADMEEVARVLVDAYRGGTVLPLGDWSPVRIQRAYRSSLQVVTGGDQTSQEVPRPVIIVSADWTQYTSKGE